MYKKLRETEGKIEYNAIKKVLDKIKNLIENVLENEKSKIAENKKITNIVVNILKFNRQHGEGLKILTPDQVLSRIPIVLLN